MNIKFAKYEGTGNDFIMIDARNLSFTFDSKLIAELCDRHFGIGADGIMTLQSSQQYDCSMRYYNADGSVGEMCGNGARCFTLFAEHLGIGGKSKTFDSLDGPHTAQLLYVDTSAAVAEIGIIDVNAIECGDGYWFLNTGVPHYVEFTDNIAAVDVVARGRILRYDKRFEHGTNVNFVEITGDGRIRMRTYERGVENETLACGTGATAASIIVNFVKQPNIKKYRVETMGGELCVEFDHTKDTQLYKNIKLSGKAQKVFDGTFDTDNF